MEQQRTIKKYLNRDYISEYKAFTVNYNLAAEGVQGDGSPPETRFLTAVLQCYIIDII